MSARDDRIETYYHEGARDLAERIVDLEDQAATVRAEVLRKAHAAISAAQLTDNTYTPENIAYREANDDAYRAVQALVVEETNG